MKVLIHLAKNKLHGYILFSLESWIGKTMTLKKNRCSWCNEENPLYIAYHDNEWAKPVKDDRLLFELLTLEGAQAGLSWETILNKRTHYKKVFDDFDVTKVARYNELKIKKLLQDPGIVRNKLKVSSTVTNAQCFTEMQNEFGSFSSYIWGFTKNDAEKISKDLKKRGFRFV